MTTYRSTTSEYRVEVTSDPLIDPEVQYRASVRVAVGDSEIVHGGDLGDVRDAFERDAGNSFLGWQHPGMMAAVIDAIVAHFVAEGHDRGTIWDALDFGGFDVDEMERVISAI